LSVGLEGGIARIEFRKDLNARSVKTGYGRLFFRQGKSFSASLKLLSTDTRTQAGVGHLNISLPLSLLHWSGASAVSSALQPPE
jgi:hypothetical protein